MQYQSPSARWEKALVHDISQLVLTVIRIPFIDFLPTLIYLKKNKLHLINFFNRKHVRGVLLNIIPEIVINYVIALIISEIKTTRRKVIKVIHFKQFSPYDNQDLLKNSIKFKHYKLSRLNYTLVRNDGQFAYRERI